ncbi:serine/threonine-protein kinase VIK isoform X2 [Physcomitrium patens]|nr:integrin-linked protein kinase 1-like isoform X2 [Physcomitrium patens]|eukprot:XP_024369505.1 integrin-linked protein kinase 1-like isoform X2 [Physcomitrella patens]
MDAPKVAEEVGNLLFYASKGNAAGVKKLLDQGMPVDATDYDGRTALHLAASEGHTDIVKLLLEYNADVNPIDRNGDTPLANAKEYDHKEICKILEARRGYVKIHGLDEFEISIAELNLDQGKFIGKGAFGEIRVVKWRGTVVAAKTITAELSKDPQIVKEFVDELALLANLSHPNIVQFLGAVTTQRPMVMVTEYLPKGDLHDLMQKRGKLDAETAIRFALDIARGMNYLHEHKPNAIVHRDLKPRNLLQHDAGHLKVADFGLGKLLDPLTADANALYEMTGETGSYRYMAPEVFMHKHYDKSVDVFSFSIIVQE